MSSPIFLAAIACAVLAGCSTSGGAQSPDADGTLEIPLRTLEAQPSERPVITDALPPELLAEILSAGADEAGVEEDAVEVVVAEAVTWSDGSIGCPEPGMMYTQALVPGYRVVLEVDSRQLNFHATEAGDFQFCEDPRPPLERSPTE